MRLPTLLILFLLVSPLPLIAAEQGEQQPDSDNTVAAEVDETVSVEDKALIAELELIELLDLLEMMNQLASMEDTQ